MLSGAAAASVAIAHLPPEIAIPHTFEPFLFAPGATVSGQGVDFAGSHLTVNVTSNYGILNFQTFIQAGNGVTSTSDGDISLNNVIVAHWERGPDQNGQTYDGPMIITFGDGATAGTVQAVLRQVGYVNASEDRLRVGMSETFQLQTADGTSSPLYQQTVTISDVPYLFNAQPDATLQYRPGNSLLYFALNIELGVNEDSFADGTKLIVKLPQGTSQEKLSILSWGNAYFTFKNHAILIYGEQVATYTGGTGSNPLIVTFDNQYKAGFPWSAYNVSQLIHSLTYTTTQTQPTLGEVHPITIQLRSANTGLSSNILTVPVQMTGDLNLTGGGKLVTYQRGGPPTIAASNVFTLGSEQYFAGSILTLQLNNGAGRDQFTILAGNGLTVTANQIRYKNVLIANFTGGVGKTPLTITFTAKATKEGVDAVLHQAAFFNDSPAASTAYTRSLSINFTDALGGQGGVAGQWIKVTA
ncbi:hypothetical protein SAMN05421753_105191 [Planctomicrobium piriforme]|uniref:Uncharacterized protein n=2 Tax=Planctomicrobium piriforme TaxID=1576369 RepID=A0A1I3FDK9_9PLAN|nr:hypothetical protein SAMN05421753_105191 [Planctomicrobium piriforme]